MPSQKCLCEKERQMKNGGCRRLRPWDRTGKLFLILHGRNGLIPGDSLGNLKLLKYWYSQSWKRRQTTASGFASPFEKVRRRTDSNFTSPQESNQSKNPIGDANYFRFTVAILKNGGRRRIYARYSVNYGQPEADEKSRRLPRHVWHTYAGAIETSNIHSTKF